MPFSAFARFGNGFRFSGKAPVGQVVYETLRDGMGSTYDEDFDGRQQARLFSQAMCLSASHYETERAGNNQNPLTADELLPAIERDYRIVPPPSSTKAERRMVAAARRLVSRGARREAVEDALRTLLGSAFIAYETTDAANVETFPVIGGFPVGAFAATGSQKKILQLLDNVSATNAPVTVSFLSVGGTDGPTTGESYTFDSDSRHPSVELVKISSVTASTITATFRKAHAKGAIAVRPHPLWISSKRYARVVVTFDAATDPETRRKINEQMRRQLRGVSQWCIVSNAGSFHFGSATRARLGATRLLGPTDG
jgi:hypothetical protein